MAKTEFIDKNPPTEPGTVLTAQIMDRLNNQVPTGEGFDGSAPLLHGQDVGAADAYVVDFVFGKKVSVGQNNTIVANALVDTGATFATDGVQVGFDVVNALTRAAAKVTGVSETQLDLDADIFTNTDQIYGVGRHLFQAPMTLVEGLRISFKAANTNTGASTLNVNGLGSIPIRRVDGSELEAGDITGGRIIDVKFNFDGSEFVIISEYALATPISHGFMSSQDKTKLDSIDITHLSIRDISRNLIIANNSTNPLFQLDISFDELILQDDLGVPFKAINISRTVDITISGENGLDSGTEANTAWYYVWLIAKPDGTVNGLLSSFHTSPVMPAGYTFKARVGAILNNSAGNFITIFQKNNVVSRQSVNIVYGGGATTLTMLSLILAVPYTCKRVTGYTGTTSTGQTSYGVEVAATASGLGLVKNIDTYAATVHCYFGINIIEPLTLYYRKTNLADANVTISGWEY